MENLMTREECEKCPLSKEGRELSINPYFPKKANLDILFVGVALGDFNDEYLRILNKYTQVLRREGKRFGFTNTTFCENIAGEEYKKKVVESCNPVLEQVILSANPKLIVAMGKSAIVSLTGSNVGVTKLSGRVMKYKETPLLLCLHPEYVINSERKVDETRYKEFDRGILPALSFFKEQVDVPCEDKDTLSPADEEVGFDIETTSLHPEDGELVCFAISDGARAVFVEVKDD